jgi:hypothetical protein
MPTMAGAAANTSTSVDVGVTLRYERHLGHPAGAPVPWPPDSLEGVTLRLRRQGNRYSRAPREPDKGNAMVDEYVGEDSVEVGSTHQLGSSDFSGERRWRVGTQFTSWAFTRHAVDSGLLRR